VAIENATMLLKNICKNSNKNAETLSKFRLEITEYYEKTWSNINTY